MNLMLNGVEAMRDMTAPGTLTFMSRRSENGELAVSILDTGVGVSPEQIDQIFSAFITSKPQGTGMGSAARLSILTAAGCGRLLIPDLAQHFSSSCPANPRHTSTRNSGTRQMATFTEYHLTAAR